MLVPLDDAGAGALLATDLANSTSEVRYTAGDLLTGPGALRDLLAGHDLDRLPSESDVAAVRALRPRVRAVVQAEDAALLATGAAELTLPVGTGPVLDGAQRWCVALRPGAALVDELALRVGVGLLAVLRTSGFDRFRGCAAPRCRGVFVDTSRGGRRRYCVPEVCGNRVNVATYRARRRAAGGESHVP